MRYIRPHYYDAFQCVAGACPDTCCAGWQIIIDEESLDRYARAKGAFGKRLEESIDWEEGMFRQKGRRCSFLNEENLCDLYKELGEGALCQTCTRYPRHVEEFADLREYSLSLSCPIAAGMILECEEPVRFLETEDDKPDELEEEFEDFDYLLFTQLEDAREVILRIVQERKIGMKQREELVLQMAKELQSCVDEERFFDVDEVTRSYEKKLLCLAEKNESEKRSESRSMRERYTSRCKEFSILLRLERLREEWSDLLQEAWETLYENGETSYLELTERFDREVGYESRQREDWSCKAEQLMVFFVYTYFCGAVYDDQIYSKAALAVFCTEWIEELVMARWALQGSKVTKADYLEVAYRLAREIEHSDENLEMLEAWLGQDE